MFRNWFAVFKCYCCNSVQIIVIKKCLRNFLVANKKLCIFVQRVESERSHHFVKSMDNTSKKKIILVGDRVLIHPDKEQEKSRHGLYLPPGVKEKDRVQSGYISKTGPGYPVINPNFVDQESWSTTPRDPVKYIPLQAEEGDYALFLRDAAIEIEYEGEQYLIVQQSQLLMLIRRDTLAELGL